MKPVANQPAAGNSQVDTNQPNQNSTTTTITPTSSTSSTPVIPKVATTNTANIPDSDIADILGDPTKAKPADIDAMLKDPSNQAMMKELLGKMLKAK